MGVGDGGEVVGVFAIIRVGVGRIVVWAILTGNEGFLFAINKYPVIPKENMGINVNNITANLFADKKFFNFERGFG